MRTDGSQLERMTDDDFVNWFPHPSPDGSWVLFLAYPSDTEGHPRDKDVALKLMLPEGGAPKTIAAFNGGQGTMNVPNWAPKQQATYWGAAIVALMLLLWILGDVILPFVVGGAIAYCLDPVADRLERMGCSRVISVTIITLVAGLIFLLLILLVIPTLISETVALIEEAPTYLNTLQTSLTERFPQLVDETSTIRKQLTAFAEMIQSRGGDLINGH